MAKLVLRPYATALFEIAEEQDQVEQFKHQVQVVIKVLRTETQFIELLKHPKILVDEKLKLIENVFSNKVADEITGTMLIIIKKGRQDVLLDILELFLEMVREYQGIIKATVTSAVQLSNEQLAQIKQKIEGSTNKTVELHTIVQPEIIGGMIIRVGDRVVDASIAGRLQTLKDQLVNLRLA